MRNKIISKSTQVKNIWDDRKAARDWAPPGVTRSPLQTPHPHGTSCPLLITCKQTTHRGQKVPTSWRARNKKLVIWSPPRAGNPSDSQWAGTPVDHRSTGTAARVPTWTPPFPEPNTTPSSNPPSPRRQRSKAYLLQAGDPPGPRTSTRERTRNENVRGHVFPGKIRRLTMGWQPLPL